MRAGEAAWLLDAIARNQEVELSDAQGAGIEALLARDLVRTTAAVGSFEQTRLADLRGALFQLGQRRAVDPDPALVTHERALRTEILELSERVARSEGATVLRTIGGSPYRGGAGEASRVQLTQRGRALLADLRPRAARVEAMPLDAFETEMRALRAAFDHRARRAAEILARSKASPSLGSSGNPVAVGLAMMRTDPAGAALAFDAALGRVRQQLHHLDPVAQVAAAECLCLTAVEPGRAAESPRPETFARVVVDLQHRFRIGNEDALDTAALLAQVPAGLRDRRLVMAQELASRLRARGRQISLAYAVIALAGYEEVPEHLHATLSGLDDTLARELRDPAERMATAVLIAFPQVDVRAHLPRWRTLRQYLSRVSPDGMAVEAALLAWLSPSPDEILDVLRLASQALTKHGVAGSGAETITTASKLLLGMAGMAGGREGDPEEALALAPRAPEGLAHLGLSGTLASLPAAAVQAFHYTVLQLAQGWELAHHPTHSSYVFGRSSRGHYRG